MKKNLIVLLLALLLLLVGCGEEVPLTALPAETPTETTAAPDPEATTEPQTPSIYFLKEQTYYDSNGNQLIKMTTTLNDVGMPVTLFTDSGKDVTHTVLYDEQGQITGFQQIETLYGENTTTVSKVNKHGDVISQISEAGSNNESSIQTTYAYDSQGNIVEKNQTKDGAFYYSETCKYDNKGNLISKETLSSDNVTTKYTYTYSGGLLVKTEQIVDDAVNQTTVYTYDEEGKLIEKKVDGDKTYAYTYNEKGVLKKLIVTKGVNVNYCEYDEQGNLIKQSNYTDGVMTSKIVFVWEEFTTEPTAAQLKVFDTLGIL